MGRGERPEAWEPEHRLDLHVHPAEQRAGVGSLLLTAAPAAARDEGRRSVIAEAEPGSPGEALLPVHGRCPALQHRRAA
ncbi:GNAT family N-acetyltransferase [Nonomuraea sp. NEAU-L178]|nr:GNAT family N-acetyltransferase [Nonomuraea aurantiaca]